MRIIETTTIFWAKKYPNNIGHLDYSRNLDEYDRKFLSIIYDNINKFPRPIIVEWLTRYFRDGDGRPNGMESLFFFFSNMKPNPFKE